MKQDILAKDASKIANATEAELSKLMDKYKYLDGKQDAAIRNTEAVLEQSKNNKVKIKDMIFKINVAMTQYNTSVVYNVKGKRMQVDKENYELFLKDGYVDGKVFIFKKTAKKTTLINTLSIGDFQLQHGEELAPMYELKKLDKNTYIIIGHEEQVMELVQQNNATVAV